MITLRPAVTGRLLACILGAAMAAGTRAQSPSNIVSDVAVVGNVIISRDAILAVAQTRPGTAFSRDIASRDAVAIRDLGYFQRVAYRDEETPSGVRVIFEVVENPQIKKIVVVGNTLIPEADIVGQMTTKVGDVLNTTRFGKDLDRIQDLYSQKGYLALIDAGQGNVVTPEGVLTITVQEVIVEAYKVVGNKKTKTYVIVREIRTPVGRPFNRVKLQEDIGRIYNQGLVEPQTYRLEPGAKPNQVIVVIEVQDKKTGQFEVGAGYSSQQGLIGRVAVSEPNLRGTGQGVSVSGEVGGRYRDSGAPPLSFQLSYSHPYIDRKRTSLGVSLYNRTSYRFSSSTVSTLAGSSSDAYEVRKGGAISFGRPVGNYTSLNLSLRDDQINTYSPLSDAADIAYSTSETDSHVSSVGLSLVKDSRDNRFDPSRGWFASVGAETGHTRLGGDTSLDAFFPEEATKGWFLKPAAEVRNYIALRPRKSLSKSVPVFAWRFKAGTATGPLSFFDQYFAGGADTLRGYSEDRFWGKNLLLLNTEVRIPIAESLTGVGFVDVGDAWGSSLRGDPHRYANYLKWATNGGDLNGDGVRDPSPGTYSVYDAYEYRFPQSNSLELHPSFGVGIRVKTPLGPLRLDYGISPWGSVTHFSIAQAF